MNKVRTTRDIKKHQELKTRPTTTKDVVARQIPLSTSSNIKRGHIIKGMREIAHIQQKPWEEVAADVLRAVAELRLEKANRYRYAIDQISTLLEEVNRRNEEIEATAEELQASNEELQATTEELQASNEELQATTEEMERANLYLKNLMDSMLDLVITTDTNGIITDVNKATERISGYHRQELIEHPFQQFFSEVNRAQNVIDSVLAEKDISNYDMVLITKDGRQVFMSFNAIDLRHADDQIYGMLFTARDVTERRRLEEVIHESEERFKILSEATSEAIALVDVETVSIIDAGSNFTETFGYQLTEVKGMKVMEVVTPEYRDRLRQNITLEEIAAHEFMSLRKDGTTFWTEIRGKRLPYRDQNIKVIAIRDVSERKNFEGTLQHYAEQLQEINASLESFSYSVSHDLRSPLRAIDGFSRIVLEDYSDKLDDEGKRLLNVIRDNTQHMGQLIDDLLTFSRIGRQDTSLSDINMEEVSKSVFEELKLLNSDRKLQLKLKASPARGDRSMLRQVFVNLLSNAIKFTKPKEKKGIATIIEIGSKVEVEGNQNVYWVKDNGVGFDMQFADKLFGVFQRLHNAEKFEGTGVGLAIVKSIICRHGGRVWAEGEVNKGATFYFTLPRLI